MIQVGPGEEYELTVKGFKSSLSTLGDGMNNHNGRKFTAK